MQSWIIILDQFAEKSDRLILAVQSLPSFQEQRHDLIAIPLGDMVLLTQSLDGRVTTQLCQNFNIDIPVTASDAPESGDQEGFESDGCGRAPRNIFPPFLRVDSPCEFGSFGHFCFSNSAAVEADPLIA